MLPRDGVRLGDGEGHAEGNILGFSVLKVSTLKERPLEMTVQG
jgi:hypothetical protein